MAQVARVRWVALLTAVLTFAGCLWLASSRSIATSTARHSYCEPPHSTTLLETRKVRIYAMPKDSVPLPDGHSVAGRPVFGCLKNIGEARLLNAPGEQEGYWFGVDEHALAIHAPLVAYAFTAYYLDSHATFVRVRNLNGNSTVRGCPAGRGLAPRRQPRVGGIVLNARASVAWSVEGGTFGNPFAVVACDSAGQHVLDSGEGIDLESLSLQNSVVSWLDDGSRREARLE